MVPAGQSEVPVWERTTPNSTPTKQQIDLDHQIAVRLQQQDTGEASPTWEEQEGAAAAAAAAAAASEDPETDLAQQIEEQDAQALDILSKLPRRDDWHGDTGDDSPLPSRLRATAAADFRTPDGASGSVNEVSTQPPIPTSVLTPADPPNEAAAGAPAAGSATAVAGEIADAAGPRSKLSQGHTASGSAGSTGSRGGETNRAYACARQGVGHLQRGELEAARKCFQRGVDVGDATEPVLLKLHAYLGELYRGERNYTSAIANGHKHLELARKVEDKTEEHRALRVLGVTHLAAGLRTMEEPDEEGDEENTQMEASSANLSKSLEYFEQLIESAKATNEALSMAQAYRDVMKVHQVLRNDPQALEAAEEHLKLIRGRGTPRDVGRAVCSVAMLRAQNGINGDIDWSKKAFDAVLELLWEQAAIGESIPDPGLVGNAYYQISKLLEDAGSWADWYGPAKARQFLQKAISSFDAVKVPNARIVAQKLECQKRLETLNSDDTGCTVQ
eukprot:m.209559 g.209559  ORF g.209559 m.209559 type:complete len:503 (-) comp15474_c0_seq3:3767-5275(-)